MSFLSNLFSSKPSKHRKIIVLNPSEFKTHIQKIKPQLIDVRTPGEFRQGNIKGAKNVDFYSFSFLKSINSLDKKKPVYLYCKSGVRSKRAAKKLAKFGFDEIFDLKGGIMKWREFKF